MWKRSAPAGVTGRTLVEPWCVSARSWRAWPSANGPSRTRSSSRACADSLRPSATTPGGWLAPSACAGRPSGCLSSASRPSSPRGSARPLGTSPSVWAIAVTGRQRRLTLLASGASGRPVTEPAAGAVRDDRRAFLRCRRRTLAACGGTVGALAVLAVLFVAPNRLASLRAGRRGAVLVGRRRRGRDGPGGARARVPGQRSGGRYRGHLAAQLRRARGRLGLSGAVARAPARFCSPTAPAGSGRRRSWSAAPSSPCSLLGTSWSRTGATRRHRVDARPVPLAERPLAAMRSSGSTETVVAGLFVWAQLAAVREVGAIVGWPRASTMGVALLVIGALLLPELLRFRLTALGGGVALAGLRCRSSSSRWAPPRLGRMCGAPWRRAPGSDSARAAAGPRRAAVQGPAADPDAPVRRRAARHVRRVGLGPRRAPRGWSSPA